MPMTAVDQEFAQMMRDNRVFEDIDPSKLDLSKGVILVACCDGDQIDDRYRFWCSLLESHGLPQRVHLITRHGGALRLAENSPLNKPGRTTDIDLIEEIEEAAPLKDIWTVILEAHGPCGKARACGLSLEASTDLHIRGKQRLRSRRNDITYATVYHIDWIHGNQPCKKRYYHFSQHRLQRARDASLIPVS